MLTVRNSAASLGTAGCSRLQRSRSERGAEIAAARCGGWRCPDQESECRKKCSSAGHGPGIGWPHSWQGGLDPPISLERVLMKGFALGELAEHLATSRPDLGLRLTSNISTPGKNEGLEAVVEMFHPLAVCLRTRDPIGP